jgi:tRNA-uridine 2-sulfurtransferase
MKKSENKKIKVALGMSGGVDSSTCAHLLVEQGYDVTGIYLECWRAPGCRSKEDRKDALKVALDLGIPFKVLDFKDAYKNKVVEYFFKEYEKGLTPNPDVMCNKEIKFGLFYDWAMDEGFDYVATGHYAKILEPKENQTSNKKQLLIPKDTHKDQTYFLYLMNEDQVNHTLFPLENLMKDDVRVEAEKRGLHVSNKKDSVGICFIGDINVHEFLKERLGENPGEVVDTAGNIIGSHKGLWFYTVGQRSGFQIQANTIIKQEDGSQISKHNIPPFYVIKKDPEKNQLVVGFGGETLNDSFGVKDLHWIVEGNETLATKVDTQRNNHLFVRIRHTGELLKCEFKVGDKPNAGYIKLEKSIQGIAEGQSAVFYKQIGIYDEIENTTRTEMICLGGGVIS